MPCGEQLEVLGSVGVERSENVHHKLKIEFVSAEVERSKISKLLLRVAGDSS